MEVKCSGERLLMCKELRVLGRKLNYEQFEFEFVS